MNTQVEKCNKMGGLRREFARLRAEQKNNWPINRHMNQKNGRYISIVKELAKLPRSRFKFKNVKYREESSNV